MTTRTALTPRGWRRRSASRAASGSSSSSTFERGVGGQRVQDDPQRGRRPEVLIYNAGYLDGRELPPEKELLEHVPVRILDTAIAVAIRGPFLVAQEVLPAMRKKGEGSFFFSNNSSSLRGRKRVTGQSLYYPRVMMRTLSQVLTEEYSEHGVHVANVVIDGTINLPGTRAMPRNANRRDQIINPMKIAEAFWYLHTQDKTCWSHEIQLTPHPVKPSY